MAGIVLLPGCTERAIPPEPEPPPPQAPAPPEPEPPPPPPEPPPPPPAFEIALAAGDIAGCTERFHDEATAALLDDLEGTVLALGDNVQGPGTHEDFANCFEPSWGRHKSRIWAAVGNHEYNVEGAVPHFEYWGERAGPAGKGYYSFDLGAWRIIVLNSNLLFEEQNQWLAADLAANPRLCTLAYWHHPWFTSSAYRGLEELKRFVEILEEAGADVVLTGHAHGYERFAPADGRGTAGRAGHTPLRSGQRRRALPPVQEDPAQQRGAGARVRTAPARAVSTTATPGNSCRWRERPSPMPAKETAPRAQGATRRAAPRAASGESPRDC